MRRRTLWTLLLAGFVAAGCQSTSRTDQAAFDEESIEPYDAAHEWSDPVLLPGSVSDVDATWGGSSSGPAAPPLSAGEAQIKATQGLARIDQNRPAEAAALFEEAAALLRGGDRQSSWSETAPPLATVISGPFTLQAGAFRDRSRARNLAADVSRLGLGPARIIEKRVGWTGRLAVVQVGEFNSRPDAVSARQRVGRPDFIVAAATY
ncbi:MAG: hypothetical protein HKO59_08870 [Phycisphaerales bacterium]|nr:SPOR domain-containing protein [Phycisphaerae bacterium]NNF43598.1 hypothetical protein [Phycisphaerales bacterium]NNM26081.1 hypothetical protein [Phycisphaerales bacterium]